MRRGLAAHTHLPPGPCTAARRSSSPRWWCLRAAQPGASTRLAMRCSVPTTALTTCLWHHLLQCTGRVIRTLCTLPCACAQTQNDSTLYCLTFPCARAQTENSTHYNAPHSPAHVLRLKTAHTKSRRKEGLGFGSRLTCPVLHCC